MTSSARKEEIIKRVMGEVANMSEEDRTKFALKHPVITIEGHVISATNAVIATVQAAMLGNSMPTFIGGFQQWKAKGSTVKKGAKALYIRLPVSFKSKDEAGQVMKSEDGSDAKKQGFKWVAVFDVTQTEPINEDNGQEQAEHSEESEGEAA